MVTDRDGGATGAKMSAGNALQAARLRKRLGLRTVEKLTAELEQQNPELYERITKTTVWELETQEETILNSRKFSPNKLRAYIKVVFDGDYDRFKAETGFSAPMLETKTSTEDTSTPSVPWYVEYETPRIREWPRFIRALLPGSGVDFLYVAKSTRMAPVLSGDVLAHCRYSTDPPLLSLAIIKRRGMGLQAAWRLDHTRYGYEQVEDGEPRVFELGKEDAPFGVVTWLPPRLNSTARFGLDNL